MTTPSDPNQTNPDAPAVRPGQARRAGPAAGGANQNRPATASRGVQTSSSTARRVGSDGSSFRRVSHGSTTRSGIGMQTGSLGRRRLRYRFMIVLAAVTVVVMVLLGMAVSLRANTYLFSQKQHDGLELAKIAAQVVNAAADRLDHIALKSHDGKTSQEDLDRVVADMQNHLRQAVAWRDRETADILSISVSSAHARYPFPRLSGIWLGAQEESPAVVVGSFTEMFIPKFGTDLELSSEQVAITELVAHLKDRGEVPIYRFKVPLDARLFGRGSFNPDDPKSWDNIPHVRLDIEITSIRSAFHNLTLAIIIIVLIATAAMMVAADWLARRVTRPIEKLVIDMQTVAKGDLGHQTVPRSDDEIGLLAVEFNRMTGQLKEAQSALVEQEKAEYELSIAREVQKQMLPLDASTTTYPDGGTFYAFPKLTGWSVGAYYKGAKAVSGDYFDVIELGDGLWGMCIADVSGKGIPGSMVMAVTRTIVRLVASKHLVQAHETLKETNRLIARQIKRGMFVTSFYAVLDERTGQLTYASAGHNPVVIYRAATRSYELSSCKGIALGFNEGPIFDRTIEINRTVLQRGDGVVLYTDGFPEAMNEKSQEFGDERFYEAVTAHAGGDSEQTITQVVAEIAKHRGNAEQSDDLTILAAFRA